MVTPLNELTEQERAQAVDRLDVLRPFLEEDVSLLQIAHLHRREAQAPNEIWQADHCLLDILLVREGQAPAKPWLTVVMDDYSRAVAGYFLTFDAPSALNTSLALRQAIWRKDEPRWHVCGIPQILYTDCGSDFKSQHIEQVSLDLKIRLMNSM